MTVLIVIQRKVLKNDGLDSVCCAWLFCMEVFENVREV